MMKSLLRVVSALLVSFVVASAGGVASQPGAEPAWPAEDGPIELHVFGAWSWDPGPLERDADGRVQVSVWLYNAGDEVVAVDCFRLAFDEENYSAWEYWRSTEIPWEERPWGWLVDPCQYDWGLFTRCSTGYLIELEPGEWFHHSAWDIWPDTAEEFQLWLEPRYWGSCGSWVTQGGTPGWPQYRPNLASYYGGLVILAE